MWSRPDIDQKPPEDLRTVSTLSIGLCLARREPVVRDTKPGRYRYESGWYVRRFGSVSEIRPVAADSAPSPGQGLVLRTRFFRLDWTLRFTHTTVTIDDGTYELPWGAHYFPLEPGIHQLGVSYPYLNLSRAGKASTAVDVSPDQVVQASYRSPNSVLLAFRPGKLTVELPVES